MGIYNDAGFDWRPPALQRAPGLLYRKPGYVENAAGVWTAAYSGCQIAAGPWGTGNQSPVAAPAANVLHRFP